LILGKGYLDNEIEKCKLPTVTATKSLDMGIRNIGILGYWDSEI
jgi:hypothetical protein